MKSLFVKSALAVVIIAAFVSLQSCSWVEADHNDWTESFIWHPQEYYDSVRVAKAEQDRIEREQFVADSLKRVAEKYQAQRNYHKNPHIVLYGQMLSWTGSNAGALASLPNEFDYISINQGGGTKYNVSTNQIDDLREFQKRGGKAWLTWSIDKDGDKVKPKGWMNITDVSNDTEAMKAYANRIADIVEQYGFNGFELKVEPDKYNNENGLKSMITTLSERFKAYNEKLTEPDRWAYLVINIPSGSSSDGFWSKVKSSMADKVDLLICQTNGSTLDGEKSVYENANNDKIKDASRVIYMPSDSNLSTIIEAMKNLSEQKHMGLGVDIKSQNLNQYISDLKDVKPSNDRWHPLWPDGEE